MLNGDRFAGKAELLGQADGLRAAVFKYPRRGFGCFHDVYT
jgi:hypothetical protein